MASSGTGPADGGQPGLRPLLQPPDRPSRARPVHLRPQLPFNCLDGILGWQYEVYRSEITQTIDGAGMYATSVTGSTSARVVVEDTWSTT